MRHLSSDTRAKVSAGAIVAVLGVAAVIGIVAGVALTYTPTESYTVTIEVTDMEVASDSGSVYNVMRNGYYYDPMTKAFDSATKSTLATLYASFGIGSKENYSDSVLRTVQTGTPTSSATIADNRVSFKVSSDESYVTMHIFLMLKGYTNDAADGTIIDLYSSQPGNSGVSYSIDLKDYSETVTLIGNDGSEIRGLLKFTVTVKPD